MAKFAAENLKAKKVAILRDVKSDYSVGLANYFTQTFKKLGGEVIIAPFDIETIARIPKTVYAFNPMLFVCESLEQMDALLESYLDPIAARNGA